MDHLKKLSLYEVNVYYIKYLSQYQDHLFYSDGEKVQRKYVGIILEINGYDYFAPLSSFKKKHLKMDEGVDIIKLRDYAVININNMIPVPQQAYKLVDVGGVKDPHYRYLLNAEIREINRQKTRICKNAAIVYNHKVRNGDGTPLAKRTNDFQKLEKACKEYSR